MKFGMLIFYDAPYAGFQGISKRYFILCSISNLEDFEEFSKQSSFRRNAHYPARIIPPTKTIPHTSLSQQSSAHSLGSANPPLTQRGPPQAPFQPSPVQLPP